MSISWSDITRPADPVEARIWRTWRELRRGPSLRRLAVISYGDGDGTAPDLTQVDMMEVIAAHQPILMGDLALRLGIDTSTATRGVEKLERRELVRRSRRADDGRFIAVRLTALGERQCAQFATNRLRAMHSILADFDEADKQDLAELLDGLASGLQKFVTDDER